MPELRGGAVLPPVKARIFDIVKAAGEPGITSRELMSDAYEGRRRPKRLDTIRNHINQINELMAAGDWRIVCRDRRHWTLEPVGAFWRQKATRRPPRSRSAPSGLPPRPLTVLECSRPVGDPDAGPEPDCVLADCRRRA